MRLSCSSPGSRPSAGQDRIKSRSRLIDPRAEQRLSDFTWLAPSWNHWCHQTPRASASGCQGVIGKKRASWAGGWYMHRVPVRSRRVGDRNRSGEAERIGGCTQVRRKTRLGSGAVLSDRKSGVETMPAESDAHASFSLILWHYGGILGSTGTYRGLQYMFCTTRSWYRHWLRCA